MAVLSALTVSFFQFLSRSNEQFIQTYCLIVIVKENTNSEWLTAQSKIVASPQQWPPGLTEGVRNVKVAPPAGSLHHPANAASKPLTQQGRQGLPGSGKMALQRWGGTFQGRSALGGKWDQWSRPPPYLNPLPEPASVTQSLSDLHLLFRSK